MSEDKWRQDESATDAVARCSLAHARDAAKHYGKNARPPREADEEGAVNVVDLLPCDDPSHVYCGGRLVFVRIGTTAQCEVRMLPRREQP